VGKAGPNVEHLATTISPPQSTAKSSAHWESARRFCHARPRRGPSDALLPGGDLPNRDPVDFAASLIQEYASLKRLLRIVGRGFGYGFSERALA
jgi:hypothetical protein